MASFADIVQTARACRALCAMINRVELFTLAGPTPTAIEYAAEGSAMSSGEKLMFGLAWDLWTGEETITIGECLTTLDGKNLRAVASLLMALSGAGDVEAWIDARTPSEVQHAQPRPQAALDSAEVGAAGAQ